MARKKKAVEEDNELRWLATYGDVVTLMLAFFVMLYAISQVDQQKFLLFVSGLESTFQNTSLQDGVFEGGNAVVGAAWVPSTDIGDVGDNLIEDMANLDPGDSSVTPTTLPTLPPDYVPPTEGRIIEDGDIILLTASDFFDVKEEAERVLGEAGLLDAVDFEITTRGIVLAIATDDVLFASGSARFGQRGVELIEKIAPLLVSIENEVIVEGHTDNVPHSSPIYDNWDLSSDRALAVLRVMERAGVDPTRLAAAGYGEHRPRATNDTEEGRRSNRRVEVLIVAGKE